MATVEGRNQIEGARWLTLRSALKIEITTGMKRSSRGRSTLTLVNEVTGRTDKNKRAAYAALDAKIVSKLGMPGKPL